MIHIVLVSRQNLSRHLLANCLATPKDFAVAAELANAADTPAVCAELLPDLLLFDVALGDMEEVFRAIEAVKKSCPSVKIMILSRLSDSSLIDDARDRGVDSFLFYNCAQEGVITCVRGTAGGYRIYPNEEMCREIDPFAGMFTRREIKLLCMLCKSQSREEIGIALFLSPSSIKGCVSSILNKSGYDNISQLLSAMLSRGCLAPR